MLNDVGPMIFTYQDINDAYSEMQRVKEQFTEVEETRNGPARAFQYPVLLCSAVPGCRVLFDDKRDANPFFHYMEAIWMLSGSENVDFPSRFAKQIRQYSDDGITLHGAYGYRWRQAFEIDQIDTVVHRLKSDPGSRRLVISMWDPMLDLDVDSKDLPCNTQLYLRVVQDSLHMTVLNRSNDMVWGMLGANYVHFGILLEYIANTVGLKMGNLYQFTNNLHVYEGWGGTDKYSETPDHWYRRNPTFLRWEFSSDNFDWGEAADFVEDPDFFLDSSSPRCRILRDNAGPMFNAWMAHKDGDDHLALHHVGNIHDEDWKEACARWITRRMTAK